MTEDRAETVDIEDTAAKGEEGEAQRRNLEIPAMGMARRPVPPANNPFAMGAFGASPMMNQPAAPVGPGHNSARNADSDSRKLVIGEGISIAGEINSCEYLVVEGKVKSDFKASNRLDISETGEFSGSAEINEADIAGQFDGTLIVEGRLTIRATAKITGTLYYGELAVEGGAVIEGKIATIAKKPGAEKGKKAADKAASAPAKKEAEGGNVAQMQLATG